MRKLLFVACALLTIGFGAAANQDMNSQFNKYKDKLVQDMWRMYPGWASSIGYHNYDSLLPVPDAAARANEIRFCKSQLIELKKYPLASLNSANKTDYYLIENQMKYSIWSIEQLKSYEWDPSTYNVCGSFADMLGNDYAPLEQRLKSFGERMDKVPAYYSAAKKNVKNPTLEHTKLAIDQNMGGISVFRDDLNNALQKSKLTTGEKAKLLARATDCIAAINSYVSWLKNTPNVSQRSFRLGAELYKRKFEFEIQSGYTALEIFHKAEAHKAELHSKMFAITKQLWPKYFKGMAMPANELAAINEMIGVLSQKHVKPEEFQEAIEKQLPFLVNFIKQKDLLYIDPSKPLVVRREPDYMAGVAGASINAPGPYDKNGNTYYNVGSLDGWDKEKAESYLREYNHYILQILNIHEAIPGHYTQLVYANQSPSIIKSILGNNAMIEGWAVYTERMMLENGYDGDLGSDAKEASPEMWLMYYKWNLRSTCNTILDYKVHTMQMSREDAMKLLVTEAFQQKAEAEGKWKRVSVSQVQLCCYFTGYSEIYALREEMKNKLKEKFNLKKFHEQFLSYGSAPVKYIRQAMLE
ncbi:MAG: DUF885 domain-containing protein [Taibaiella sp.]|nr:DUF885 domain-containing protein [Taibaiella sp.]